MNFILFLNDICSDFEADPFFQQMNCSFVLGIRKINKIWPGLERTSLIKENRYVN